MRLKLRYVSSLVFSLTEKICLAIPQGKDYSVEEGHYARPSNLLILLVPIVLLIGIAFLFKYLSRYKDSAKDGITEAAGIVLWTLSNGMLTFLKVMLFGLGLFAVIILYVLLSKYDPFCNMGVVGEKIMLALFVIVAFGFPSIYKYLTKKSTPCKQTRRNQSITQEIKVIDTDEGVVDLGLSVLWTDASFPLNLTFRDMRESYLFSNAFRFPTKEELDELRKKCKWEKTYIDEGHFGFKVVGPNGNSIFLQSSYKNDNSVKKELTTYPIYISIYFNDKGKVYKWRYSKWSGWLLDEHIEFAHNASNSYVGKIIVKNKKVN